MSSIISEVALLSERLFESAVIIYAFSVELLGLERKIFSPNFIKMFEKKNKRFA